MYYESLFFNIPIIAFFFLVCQNLSFRVQESWKFSEEIMKKHSGKKSKFIFFYINSYVFSN